MEPSITNIYSSFGNDTSTNATTSETSWRVDHQNIVLELVFAGATSIIIGFGTISNIVVFIVMGKGSLADVSTCFYMRVLALADTGKEHLH